MANLSIMENSTTRFEKRKARARKAADTRMRNKSMSIESHEGSKYLRPIHSAIDDRIIVVDVYSVLEAFKVTCPARQHAIKKLLCAGIRGKGSERDDLIGARAAIEKAIELQDIRDKNNEK